jgi:hypothetical protein
VSDSRVRVPQSLLLPGGLRARIDGSGSRAAARIEIRGYLTVSLGVILSARATELPARQLALAYHARSVPLTCCRPSLGTSYSQVILRTRQSHGVCESYRQESTLTGSRKPSGMGFPAFDDTLMHRTTGAVTKARGDGWVVAVRNQIQKPRRRKPQRGTRSTLTITSPSEFRPNSSWCEPLIGRTSGRQRRVANSQSTELTLYLAAAQASGPTPQGLFPDHTCSFHPLLCSQCPAPAARLVVAGA